MGSAVSQPKPPFTFEREDLSGTQLKIFVRDAAGVRWNVKFGYEVKTESFCWRLAQACGYFTESSFYVRSGQVQGMGPTQRHWPTLQADGRFTDARFQYRDPQLEWIGRENWRWDGPPFGGTRELSGLKILIMLVSNWDNKDGRAGPNGGPNTGILERASPRRERIYAFTDWGSGMGNWGDGPSGQTDWNCMDFTAQTRDFVKGKAPNTLVFGYGGVIDKGFQTGIPPAHAAWLMQYLGRISDIQLRTGLLASGAGPGEADCFSRALRMRIEQLRAVGNGGRQIAANSYAR
jgi:hypothetical protein